MFSMLPVLIAGVSTSLKLSAAIRTLKPPPCKVVVATLAPRMTFAAPVVSAAPEPVPTIGLLPPVEEAMPEPVPTIVLPLAATTRPALVPSSVSLLKVPVMLLRSGAVAKEGVLAAVQGRQRRLGAEDHIAVAGAGCVERRDRDIGGDDAERARDLEARAAAGRRGLRKGRV